MNKISKLKEVIYTPRSQLVHPFLLLKNMISDLAASRELAWRLFIRNISAQYRQTMFGYLWAFLPPIVTTLTFVFLKSSKVLDFGETSVPYPIYVLIGTLLWQVFLDSIHSPIKIIKTSKKMLAKINFPREALILAGIGEVLFNLFIRLIIFFVVILWFKVPLYATIIFAPVGILVLMMFGLMIGILLTPMAVLFEDIQRSLTVMTSLWFFLTPVVYSTPKTWPASIIATYNPVSPLLITTRNWILLGQTESLVPFAIISLSIFFMTIVGWVLYRLAMPHLISRIGS